LLQDARSRDLVEYVERVVDERRKRRLDGCCHHAAYEGSHDAAWARNAKDSCRAVKSGAYAAWQTSTSDRYDCDPTYAAYCDAGLAAYEEIIADGPISTRYGIRWKRERRDQSALLRDIFGNPFHPNTINDAWLPPTVTSLAEAAYEQRALPSGEMDVARLAVLADALEEAGCENTDILTHLRAPGPHVRGCWPVDLLLGKS
jgi:hypothetical protein